MRNNTTRIRWLALACILLLAQSLASPVNAASQFELTDWIGRNWSNERVRYPLAGKAAAAAAASALVNDAGRSTPFEIIKEPDGTNSIEFLANVQPFSTSRYRFAPGKAQIGSDLRVSESKNEIRIFNLWGGVSVRRRIVGREGPINGIMLASGIWIGDSSIGLSAGDRVTKYEVRLRRRGPVAAVVEAITQFASGSTWQLRLVLQANDPAVLIEEKWSNWRHPSWTLRFGPGLDTSRAYYRVGGGRDLGRVVDQPISTNKGETVFSVFPWLKWWGSPHKGNWFSAYDPDRASALVVAALRGDLWISPAERKLKRRLEPIEIVHKDGTLEARLASGGSLRRWLLASLYRANAIVPGAVNKRTAPPPQQLVIKHGDFPLNRVKDLQLHWQPAQTERHNRLFLTENDLRQRFDWRDVSLALRTRRQKLPINLTNLKKLLQSYFASGDSGLAWRLSHDALKTMQDAVNLFVEQSRLPALGVAPHHQHLIPLALHLADFALSDDNLEPAAKKRLRAQAAFLSHIVHRPDYWDPRRGFSANPNMTTMVAGYQGLLACLISDHPRSRERLDQALAELFDRQLLRWSDKNGGWLEAPHYAIVSLDYIVSVFVCARNLGRDDLLFHPRLKKVVSWLAKISSPPDARLGGRSHLPAIGNTYVLEPTSLFGVFAHIWRTRDPEFAAKMAWMHQQQGCPTRFGVGGRWPGLAPYAFLWEKCDARGRPPQFRSELFPESGAILRAHFATGRETRLYMIAGRNHAHYDHDSGSVTIWGKGEIIADDFGYYGRAPSSEHSMLSGRFGRGPMQVSAFSTTGQLDTVFGRQGHWYRSVALIKDSEPLGLSYFVMRDRLTGGKSGTWRLWLTGERVERLDDRVRVVGRGEIDTDIFLVGRRTSDARLETLTRTSRSSGIRNRPLATTQTALVVELDAKDPHLVALIFPRLKAEKPPKVHSKMDGRVVDIKTPAGADRIFFSEEPFSYRDSEIRFHGKAGAVLRRRSDSIIVAVPGSQIDTRR